MKSITKSAFPLLFLAFPSLLFFLLFINFSSQAQSYCSSPKDLGHGYSTSISSVNLIDETSEVYKIILRVEHNGCPGSDCEALNHFSVEAEPGSYSDIEFEVVSGNIMTNGINLGPNLGGWDKEGFRIASISGLGSGYAGVFNVIYTLSGGLQDQHVMAKANSSLLETLYSISDFEEIRDCPLKGAYAMPKAGKITDSDNKIGPELTALSEYEGIPVSDEVYMIVYDESTNTYYVVAEFTSKNNQYTTLKDALELNYGFIMEAGDGVNVMTGQTPINQLSSINDLTSLSSARPVYPVTTNSGLITTSQGDTSMVSDITRQIFSVHNEGERRFINGDGIQIGVLSNSYDTKPSDEQNANYDVANFELPGAGNWYNDTPVNVIKDYPYGEASDEGRAMMQIIHDVAPGADLHFRTGVMGAVDMAAGIDELVAAGCNIIVDDITYITQAFFEDGIVALKVNEVNDAGVSYFTSAGNFGGKSYASTFIPANKTVNGLNGTPHKFGSPGGSDDIFQQATAKIPESATAPQHYTIVLQWDDDDETSTFDATKTDMDIYLANEYEYGVGLMGFNTVNIGKKAIEILSFIGTEETYPNIVVVKASDNDVVVDFKYVVFNGQFDIDEFDEGNATIVGHANSAGAMTVGAIRYDKTPAYGGILDIMSFSSIGGHMVSGTDRYKPDFTAPNGVNTTVDLGNGDWDGDIDVHPNFFGTSASAPHAAAVAALLLDAQSAYESTYPYFDIKTILSSTAIGSGAYDPIYGNGFIQADAALLEFANPAPLLYQIVNVSGEPGTETATVTVSASYLTEETMLYFNGVEMESNQVDVSNGTLTADIPPFTELYPPITAYNPPRDEITNGKDGGMSNALYFKEKPTILGTVPDITKYYGEELPDNPISYVVVKPGQEPQSLSESGLNNDQIMRINEIDILNAADALSNALIWPYYVDPNDWLNPLHAENPPEDISDLETELLTNYDFEFHLGELEILKLELTIKPNDLNLDYGDPIPELEYTFNYNASNMSPENNDIIQEELLLAYTGDIINDRTAIVDEAFYMSDGEGGLVPNSYFMTRDAYENGQSLALVNGKALALVNGKALALVNGQSLALVNEEELATLNGKALALVNGKALALVNRQALALVNTEAETNGLALALVNRQALALVNDALEEEAFVNGKALALVNRDVVTNKQALALVNEGVEEGLVNRQALALVNATTLSEVNNPDAIIILTVDDIELMESGTELDEIELISINTISGNTATPENEPHKIAPGAFIASNFNVHYELGNLTIEKAELEVIGNSQVISEGEDAPPFTFNAYNTFYHEDNVSSVFGSDPPDYTIPYTIESGPGEYVLEFPEVDNYYVISDIRLYVNPDGNGTKAIVPKLDCVEDDGYGNYIAYFTYENKNDVPVWVLIGEDNIVTGGGITEPPVQQPIKFDPGGGAWAAEFAGSQMVWTVSSQHHGHKTSNAQAASSNSKNCNNGRSLEEELIEELPLEINGIFPNPVNNKLILSMGESSVIHQTSLFYVFGKIAAVPVDRISDHKIELDLSALPKGIYVLKVQMNTRTETFKIIKN